MDQIQAMRVFARVVEAGTFTKAADSLDLPKGTVTKLIQTLEARLRVKLLNRTTRRVTVTPDGAAYYERAVAPAGRPGRHRGQHDQRAGQPAAAGCAWTWAPSVARLIDHPGAARLLRALPRHPARPGRERPAGRPDQRQRGLRDPRRRADRPVAGGAAHRQHASSITVASPAYLPKRHGGRSTSRPT